MNEVLFQTTKTNADFIGGAEDGRKAGVVRKIDPILLKAVDIALIASLGSSGAAAVKFYVDTTLICENPDLFESSLKKVFGGSEKGQDLIERKIEDALVKLLWDECSITIPVQEQETSPGQRKSFGEFISACRKRFNTKSLQ